MFLTVTPNMVVSKTAPSDTSKLWWDAQPVEDTLTNSVIVETTNPNIASVVGEGSKILEVVTTTSSLKKWNGNSWEILETLVGYPVTFPGYVVYPNHLVCPYTEIINVIGADGIQANTEIDYHISTKSNWMEDKYTITASNCEYSYKIHSNSILVLTISNATGPVVVTLDMGTMAPM